jgi:hypothetical protein
MWVWSSKYVAFVFCHFVSVKLFCARPLLTVVYEWESSLWSQDSDGRVRSSPVAISELAHTAGTSAGYLCTTSVVKTLVKWDQQRSQTILCGSLCSPLFPLPVVTLWWGDCCFVGLWPIRLKQNGDWKHILPLSLRAGMIITVLGIIETCWFMSEMGFPDRFFVEFLSTFASSRVTIITFQKFHPVLFS